MTQRPSGSRNAGRINCFPTKTLRPFLSQSILSQSILSQSILSQSEALLRPEVEMTHVSWTPPAVVRANRNESASVEVKAVLNVRYCPWTCMPTC
jgi:hypothetical protein